MRVHFEASAILLFKDTKLILMWWQITLKVVWV